MPSFLDDLKKKAANIAKAGYNGVNVLDGGRGYTSAPARPVVVPNITNAKYGVLANNPQAQQQFQQSVQPTRFNPVRAGLSTLGETVTEVPKAFGTSVVNSAKLPYQVGQAAAKQLNIGGGYTPEQIAQAKQTLSNTYNTSMVGGIATPAIRGINALGQTPLSPTYGAEKKLRKTLDEANKTIDKKNTEEIQHIQQGVKDGVYDPVKSALAISQLAQVNTMPGRAIQQEALDRINAAGFSPNDSGFGIGRKFLSNVGQSYLNVASLGTAAGAGTGARTLLNAANHGGLNMAAANVVGELGQDKVNLANLPVAAGKGYLGGALLAPAFHPINSVKALGEVGGNVINPKYGGLTKNQIIMDPAKLNILNEAKDVLDTMYKRGEAPTTQQAQRIIDGLHKINDDHGLDFITGNNNQRVQKITQFLEQNGEAIPKFQKSLRGQEGGYVRLPRTGSEKKAAFKGVDGQPRIELDDSAAKMKPIKTNPENGIGYFSGKATDVFEHKKLFKDFPELKDTKVSLTIDPKIKNPTGQFTDSISRNSDGTVNLGKELQVNAANPEAARSVMLHELQHAIQEQEGLARGGSILEPDQARIQAIKQQIQENTDAFPSIKDPATRRKVAEYVMQLEDEMHAIEDAPYRDYLNLAGEAEARAVESRRNMKPNERRSKEFYDSLDVQKKDLTLKGVDTKKQQLVDPLDESQIPRQVDVLEDLLPNRPKTPDPNPKTPQEIAANQARMQAELQKDVAKYAPKKPLPSQDTKSIKREIAELDRKIDAFTEDSPAKQSLIDRQMKLVDELEGGTPQSQKLYHGSNAKFERFDQSKTSSGDGSDLFGKGAYLTDNKNVADFYALARSKQDFIDRYTNDGPLGTDMPVYKKDADTLARQKAVVNEFIADNLNILDATTYKIDGDVKNVFVNDMIKRGLSKAEALEEVNRKLTFARNSSDKIRGFRGELEYMVKQFPGTSEAVAAQLKKSHDGVKYASDKTFEGKPGNNYVIYNTDKLQTNSPSKPSLLEKLKRPLSEEGGGKNAPKNQAEADAMFGENGRFSKKAENLEESYKSLEQEYLSNQDKVREITSRNPVKGGFKLSAVQKAEMKPLVDRMGQILQEQESLRGGITKTATAPFDELMKQAYPEVKSDKTISTAKTPPTEKQLKPAASSSPKQQLPSQSRVVSSEGSVAPLKADLLPKSKPSSYANKTAQGTREISKPLKNLVKDERVSYTATTDAGRIKVADDFLKGKSDETAFTKVMQQLDTVKRNSDGQEAATAIQLIKRLDESGTEDALFKATQIFNKLSADASKSGQQIQALSALSARTPQGLFYHAQKTLEKSLAPKGKDVTPAQIKKMQQLTADIKKQVPGSYEDGLARYKLMEYVEKQSPSSIGGKTTQLWKAGLLTAPTTTAGNTLANAAEQIFKRGYKDPVAAGFDTVMSVFTGERSKSYTLRGVASGAKEGAIKGVNYFKTGYDPRNPQQKFDVKNIHYSDSPLGKAAEVYTQSVFKLMGSQDQPFYYASFRNALADQAVTAAKNSKLRGAERAAFIKKFVTEPSKKALQLADDEARYDVFQNKTALGEAASGLKDKTGAIGDFLIPFSQVPSSVATRIIDRTPLGVAKQIVKQVRNRKFDQRAMANALADGTAGAVIIGAGAALASAGQMTLSYPTDQKERDLWDMENKQANSVKIGDTWVSLNYIQPLGNLLAAGANYQNAIDSGESKTDAWSSAAAGAAKALSEQSFLKGVSGATSAISDPVNAGEKFAENTTGSLVPNFVRSAARSLDDKQRDQDGLVESFKAGIPGVRKSLPTKTDIFGKDLPRKTSALNSFLNPLRPSDIRKPDTVTQELRRLQDADEGITATKITKDALGKNASELNREQQRALKNYVGERLKTEWTKAVENPQYATLDDATKRRILDKIKGDVTKALKAQYSHQLGNDPTDLTDNQYSILTGESVDYFNKPTKKTATTSKDTPKGTSSKTSKSKSGKTASKAKGGSKKQLSNASTITAFGNLNRKVANLKIKKANFRATANKSKLVSYKKPKSQKISVTKKQLSRSRA